MRRQQVEMMQLRNCFFKLVCYPRGLVAPAPWLSSLQRTSPAQPPASLLSTWSRQKLSRSSFPGRSLAGQPISLYAPASNDGSQTPMASLLRKQSRIGRQVRVLQYTKRNEIFRCAATALPQRRCALSEPWCPL